MGVPHASTRERGEQAASRGRRRRALVISLLLVGVSSGCTTTLGSREVPDFDERFQRLESVTLLPPKVSVYRLTAGGVEEEVQEWTDSAREQLALALEKRAGETGHLRFVAYTGPQRPGALSDDSRVAPEERSLLEETDALFDVVALAIHQHVYTSASSFAEKQKNFDYTLGSEVSSLVEESGADAFLIVVASDRVATAGRQALIALGYLAAGVTGVYAGPGPSPAVVVLALVESRTGDILWFNAVSSEAHDLRSPDSDRALVSAVMKGLNED